MCHTLFSSPQGAHSYPYIIGEGTKRPRQVSQGPQLVSGKRLKKKRLDLPNKKSYFTDLPNSKSEEPLLLISLMKESQKPLLTQQTSFD